MTWKYDNGLPTFEEKRGVQKGLFISRLLLFELYICTEPSHKNWPSTNKDVRIKSLWWKSGFKDFFLLFGIKLTMRGAN